MKQLRLGWLIAVIAFFVPISAWSQPKGTNGDPHDSKDYGSTAAASDANTSQQRRRQAAEQYQRQVERRQQDQFARQQNALQTFGQTLDNVFSDLSRRRNDDDDDDNADDSDDEPRSRRNSTPAAAIAGPNFRTPEEGEQFLRQLREYLANEQSRIRQGAAQGQDVSLLRLNVANVEQTIAAAERQLASLRPASTIPVPSANPANPNSNPNHQQSTPLFDEPLSSFATTRDAPDRDGRTRLSNGDSVISGLGRLSSFFDQPSLNPDIQKPGATNQKTDNGISPELDRFVREDIDRQHAYFDAIAQLQSSPASQPSPSYPGASPNSDWQKTSLSDGNSGISSDQSNYSQVVRDLDSHKDFAKEVAKETGKALLDSAEKRSRAGSDFDANATAKKTFEDKFDELLSGKWAVDGAREGLREGVKNGVRNRIKNLPDDERRAAEEDELGFNIVHAWSTLKLDNVKKAFSDGLDLIDQRMNEITSDLIPSNSKTSK
jgi:hypothetical protein